MDLAKTLLRTMVRAFYSTEHILIVDALCLHSTLTDSDLSLILGMQTKALRRLCGKLKEDGMISVHSRGERKEGAPPVYSSQMVNGQPKERLFYRDWYYLNFHRSIDSIKYRLWKLSRHIESLGAPTTERKDLICPRCKSTYTELEVIDNISNQGFHCHRCNHLLDTQEEAEGPAENESMKRMNDQLAKIVGLMRQIDSITMPENDFDTALSHALPVHRPETNQGPRYEAVDDRKPLLASSKGLAMTPEQISVSVAETDNAESAADAAERKARKDREAKQNMLPEWISRSTVNGAITAIGAKESATQLERMAHLNNEATLREAEEEDKKTKESVDDSVMDDYWKELKAAQEREREEDEDEDDEDDDDEFEDAMIGSAGPPSASAPVNGAKSAVAVSMSATTPSTGLQSSNATDDEADGRDSKRVKTETGETKSAPAIKVEDDPQDDGKAESDEDDGLEFEDV